jgi:hypothetical protein
LGRWYTGVPARDEQNLVFDVQRQSGEPAAFIAQLVVRRDRHRFCVDHRDIGFIGNIDVDVALFIRDGLLGRAAEIERAENVARLRVDDRDVRRLVAEDIDALIEWVFENTVRIALHFDRPDQFERLRVKHGDRFAAHESVAGFNIYGDAVASNIGNLPCGSQRVEVENREPWSQRGHRRWLPVAWDV